MIKLKKLLKDPSLLILIFIICFFAVYIISFYTPPGKLLVNRIASVIPGQTFSVVYSFFGGSAQSAICTSYSGNVLKESKAIVVDAGENSELVGNVSLRIYMLATCENALDRRWRVKVNNNIIYESENCFDDWNYLEVSFPSIYLHNGENEVSLECDQTSYGKFYIGLGKLSNGNTEFFKTTYTLKNK